MEKITNTSGPVSEVNKINTGKAIGGIACGCAAIYLLSYGKKLLKESNLGIDLKANISIKI